jgi:hypothetical protein
MAVAVFCPRCRLWRVESWEGRPVQPPQTGMQTGAVAFSPDGKTLAAVRPDGGVSFWDVAKLLAKPADK